MKAKLSNSPLAWLRRAGASLLFIGYFPWASGTVGSAVTVAGIWYLNMKFPSYFTSAHYLHYWFAMMVITVVSIFLSNDSKNVFGDDDPSPVIIDEVAGQLVTFFMIPLTLKTMIAGFLLFRFYDIVKPWFVNNLQELEEGAGITLDDVAAGVLANVTLMLLLLGYNWVRAYL
jgi:phosphatidylglycerophosphatase A